VKGFNTTEADKMIIGLPGDQEEIAYSVPFSVIGARSYIRPIKFCLKWYQDG